MRFYKIKKIPEYVRGKVLKVLDAIQEKRRQPYLKKQRERLVNKEITLVSNNCNGGVLLHELGLRFNSQFIDLSIEPSDYVKYLKNFDYYNSLKIKFDENSNKKYPVGKLDDITIEFVHYKTKEQAYSKWEERKLRINPENFFVFMTEQGNCSEADVREFDKLPFKNKVVFTHKKYCDLQSAIYLKEFKDNPLGVYMFLGYRNHFSKKRKYDVFDFVAWFNGESDLTKLLKGKI